MIKLLMEGKAGGDPGACATSSTQKIRDREWPIEMLMKTDTLQDSLEKYRQKIAGGGRNRAAAYELALTSGRNYKPGDQISYYVKATPKKVAAYEAAKLVAEFDPQNRDENTDYYVGKLDDLVKKFGGATTETLRRETGEPVPRSVRQSVSTKANSARERLDARERVSPKELAAASPSPSPSPTAVIEIVSKNRPC